MQPTQHHESHQSPRTGESYSKIFGLFWPECITAFVLYSLLSLFDAKLIADLQKTSMYATLGVTSTLIHFMTKIAEGLSVATVVVVGRYNGQGKDRDVGHAAVSALWITALIAFIICSLLYIAAPAIYAWYGVPEKFMALGVPFLRLRAVGIFCMFLYFTLIGFLRGIKNTRAPMLFFVVGAAIFMFFDWALITGSFGFSQMQLQGSAIASLIQYVVMLSLALAYMLFDPTMRHYSITLFRGYRVSTMREIVSLSWPVMIDKAMLAIAKMWLVRQIAPAGKIALASFSAIKDVEQFAFVPAIAFAQVITLLVSNDYGMQNWSGIKQNIKKIMILSVLSVAGILTICSYYGDAVISFFDTKGVFVGFAAQALPLISLFVLFDVVQLILSAALRGAGDVRTVMVVRIITTFVFFIPAAWISSWIPLESSLMRFVLVYSTFYIAGALMCIVYIKRFAGTRWHKRAS